MTNRITSKRELIPKHIGFEIELGNHFVAHDVEAGAGEALVTAHHHLFTHRATTISEWVREFNSGGFRVYLDHEHAEISSPLVPSAALLTWAMRDTRRIAADCKHQAERQGGPMRVSFNNSSRQGTAWAFHGNFLVSRSAFNAWRDDDWKPLKKQWIPFLVTGLPLFGSGKVGSEHGAPPCAFQFSQRADFIDEQIGLTTTDHKNLINTRDEPLADPERYARLHVIAWDTSLLEFQHWLKFGVAQVLLALIEEGVPLPDLELRDPLPAMRVASRDTKFQEQLPLSHRHNDTALGIQQRLAAAAANAIGRGCAASAVPDADLIIEKWVETIDDLAAHRPRLARRLDWCAKLSLLGRARKYKDLDQDRLRVLDLRCAEVGGLFEQLERANAVDALEDFLPERNSTAHLPQHLPREEARSVLVNRFGGHLADVWWDYAIGKDERGSKWLIPMANPLDGHGLLKVVSHATSWEACLSSLVKDGLARRAVEHACVVIDLDRDDTVDRDTTSKKRKGTKNECFRQTTNT